MLLLCCGLLLIMRLDYYKLVDLSSMLFVWTYVAYVVLVNCYVTHI